MSLLSTQHWNRAHFRGKLIENLALWQAWAKQGIYVRAASISKIKLGHRPELDKIENEFPEVFNNTRIQTMIAGFYVIKLEDTAIPFSRGSSHTVPEPFM
jgi:hypothetical protein